MPKNRLDIIFDDAEKVVGKVDFSWPQGKTVLVTGATGLLGTHFLATLALLKERDMNVKAFGVCHSDPADYTVEIAKRGDISLVDDWYSRTDVVLHCAGYAQPSKFINNQVETIRINTALTQRLLDQLKSGGKFLFVSSSEVYSGFNGVAQESDIGTTNPSHPRACYIEGKRCGEAIINAYRQSGVDAKSVRLGITYGPGTRINDQRAMSQFIRQALINKQIEMKYPGREPRSFCYVQDAVEMMWSVLLNGTRPVYNIGSSFITNIVEIAKRIADITGATINTPAYVTEMPGSGDVQMNTNVATYEINKKSFVDLEDGLKRTIDWNRGFYE